MYSIAVVLPFYMNEVKDMEQFEKRINLLENAALNDRVNRIEQAAKLQEQLMEKLERLTDVVAEGFSMITTQIEIHNGIHEEDEDEEGEE